MVSSLSESEDAATALVKEIWAHASPELRREVADAFAKSVLTNIRKDEWYMRGKAEAVARDLMDKELSRELEMRKEEIQNLVTTRVSGMLVSCVDKVSRDVSLTIEGNLRTALAKVQLVKQ